jgi:hypothetical protein
MDFFKHMPGQVGVDVVELAFSLRLSHVHIEAAQAEFRRTVPGLHVEI